MLTNLPRPSLTDIDAEIAHLESYIATAGNSQGAYYADLDLAELREYRQWRAAGSPATEPSSPSTASAAARLEGN